MKKILNHFNKWLLENVKVSMALAFFLFSILLPGIFQLKSNFDVRGWLESKDPLVVQLDAFEKEFGNDDSILIGLESSSEILDQNSLFLIRKIENLMSRMDAISTVSSITNHEVMSAHDGSLKLVNLILPQDSISQLKGKIRADPVANSYLVSSDYKTAFIHANILKSTDRTIDYSQIMKDLKKSIAELKIPGHIVLHYSGSVPLNSAFKEIAEKDMSFILPLLIFTVSAFLFALYRSVILVAMPLLLIVFTIISTLAFSGYMGFAINNVTSVIPLVIIAIALADSIHIINKYKIFLVQTDTENIALKKSLEVNILPTMLTSLTTSIGFLALLATDIKPIRELGLLAAFSSLIAWFFSIFLLVPLLSIFSSSIKKASKKKSIEIKLTALVPFLENHRIGIVLGGAILFFVSAIFAVKVEIDSEPNAYFKDGVEIKTANNFITQTLGGTSGPEIIIDAKREDASLEIAHLEKVEQLILYLESKAYVKKTISYLNTLKSIHKAMNYDKDESYKLPNDDGAVAQENLLYEIASADSDKTILIDSLNQQIRIKVLWNLTTSSKSMAAIRDIEKKMKELKLDGFTTGKTFILYRLNDYIVNTSIYSFTISFLIVSLIMMSLFRSVFIGLVAMIPNIFPIIFGLAALYLLGKQINTGTALAGSICLGIAVDDTIHFMSSYFLEWKQAESDTDLLKKLYSTSASSLVISTLLIVLGFGSFMLADFTPNSDLGLLCCIVLIVALIIDIIWLPALLLILKPVKQK